MTNTVKISCQLSTTDATCPLGFEAWINDHKFFDTDHVTETQTISVEIADVDAEHELRFVLKNKLESHTKIDDTGHIISDARLTVTDLAFDEIQLGYMVSEQAVYTHNCNGTAPLGQHRFYGEMGCNGTVSLPFTTPIYLWLLEYM